MTHHVVPAIGADGRVRCSTCTMLCTGYLADNGRRRYRHNPRGLFVSRRPARVEPDLLRCPSCRRPTAEVRRAAAV